MCPPMPREDGIGSKTPTLCVRSVRLPSVSWNLLITSSSFGMLSAVSFRKLFFCSRSLPLQCLGKSLLPCLLSSFNFSLSNLLRGLSHLRLLLLQSPWLLQGPGTVEHSVLLLLKRFLMVCTLFFNSAAFCSSVAFLATFCIDVTSHRFHSLESVSARTWLSHSSQSSQSRACCGVFLSCLRPL